MSLTSLGLKPNVILFDEETVQPRPNTSQSEISRLPDVQNALNDLNKRILKIEIYEQVLRDKAQSLESKGTLPNTSTAINNQNHEQILNVLERKLHMLIMQSSKALQDLKDEIQRVMTKEIMDKKVNDYEIKATSERLQKLYSQKLREVQKLHSQELLKLQRKNQSIQKTFEQRLDKIETTLMHRIKQLEYRQEVYKQDILKLRNEAVDSRRIQQLEKQLQQTKNALKVLPEKTKREAVSMTKYDTTFEKDTTSRLRRNKIFEKREEQMPSAVVSPNRKQYSEFASINILSKQLEDLTSQLKVNFNQHEQGSDEDVFFYPESSKVHYTTDLQSNGSSTKISSPFDVNSKY